MAVDPERIGDLRTRIDRIDDQLHDLLMERAEIGQKIGETKDRKGLAVRPAREAHILRRLLARHSGLMPKADLVHIWQEIFGSSVRMQGPFSVAAVEAGKCRELARDQFGAGTPITLFSSSRRVIEAVSKDAASVGVLPLPEHPDSDPWWRSLVSEAAGAPKIVARLPLVGGCGRDGRDEGAVIANLEPAPSGSDRSYVVVDAEVKLSRSQLAEALQAVGLASTSVTQWHEERPPENWLHLMEVNRHLSPTDKVLKNLGEALGGRIKRIMVIGGYAVPFSDDQLV